MVKPVERIRDLDTILAGYIEEADLFGPGDTLPLPAGARDDYERRLLDPLRLKREVPLSQIALERTIDFDAIGLSEPDDFSE